MAAGKVRSHLAPGGISNFPYGVFSLQKRRALGSEHDQSIKQA